LAADDGSVQSVTAAVAQVSERLRLLVREEIELAKAEVQSKVTRLLKGIVVGVAAGVFVVTGLLFALHGLSWFAWYEIDNGNRFYVGFFVVAVGLFVLGALSGYLAYRFIRSSSPPTPTLAIDEARLIRETMQSSAPTTVGAVATRGAERGQPLPPEPEEQPRPEAAEEQPAPEPSEEQPPPEAAEEPPAPEPAEEQPLPEPAPEPPPEPINPEQS